MSSPPSRGRRCRSRSGFLRRAPPAGFLRIHCERAIDLDAVPRRQARLCRHAPAENAEGLLFQTDLRVALRQAGGDDGIAQRRTRRHAHAHHVDAIRQRVDHLHLHARFTSLARRTKASTMESAMPSKSGDSTLPSTRLENSYCRENSMRQASGASATKRQRPSKRRNGPETRCMSIASPGRVSLSVVKAWLRPPTPTVSVARVRPGRRSWTCAAVHQGRKSG